MTVCPAQCQQRHHCPHGSTCLVEMTVESSRRVAVTQPTPGPNSDGEVNHDRNRVSSAISDAEESGVVEEELARRSRPVRHRKSGRTARHRPRGGRSSAERAQSLVLAARRWREILLRQERRGLWIFCQTPRDGQRSRINPLTADLRNHRAENPFTLEKARFLKNLKCARRGAAGWAVRHDRRTCEALWKISGIQICSTRLHSCWRGPQFPVRCWMPFEWSAVDSITETQRRDLRHRGRGFGPKTRRPHRNRACHRPVPVRFIHTGWN